MELLMQSVKYGCETPPSRAVCKLLLKITLFIVIVATMMQLSGCSTKHSLVDHSLVTAACPELSPLSDNSFGTTTMKLIEVAGQYDECRTAALAGSKK